MALTDVTTTFNLSDYLGQNYDPKKVRVELVTNAEKNIISDNSTGEIRVGGGEVSVAAKGDVSATTWAPGPDANPQSWQTTFRINFVDRGTRERKVLTLGPFTIETSGLLTALREEQEVPATYLTTVTQQLDTYTDTAAASATSAAASASSAAASADLAADIAKPIDTATASPLAPGAQPTVTLSGDNPNRTLALGIPAGVADDASMAAQVGTGGAFDTALSASYEATAIDPALGVRRGKFDPRTSTYIPVGASLRKTRAKLGRVQAQEPNVRCKIAYQGHSEVAGFGSSVGLTNPAVLLRKMFAAKGYQVGTGWVPTFTNIGSGATRDGRWSYTLGSGAWEYTGSAAGGGNMYFHVRAVTDDLNAVFSDAEVTGTIAEIVTLGTSASFQRVVDGAISVVTPSGASVAEAHAVTGLPDTTHTIWVNTDSTAATYLLAASVRPATCVEVSSFGLSGARASDHLPTQGYANPYKIVDAYAPDCVILQLDANEAIYGVPVATYVTNITAIVDAHRAAGRDVLLVSTFNPSTADAPAATYLQFRKALYDLADAKTLPLVDLSHRLGTFAEAQANGLTYDTIHPNGGGYADAMQAVMAALCDDGISSSRRLPGPVIHAADNFARPDSASGGSTEVGSRAWQVTTGGSLSIAANRLVLTTATAVEADAYIDDGNADGTFQVTLTSMAASNGLLFRASSASDGYLFWRNAGTGAIKLSRRTAPGVYTDVSASAITTAGRIGDVMKVVASGQTVKLYVRGSLVYTHTDTDNTAKTRCGLWKANTAGSVSMDSFIHTT